MRDVPTVAGPDGPLDFSTDPGPVHLTIDRTADAESDLDGSDRRPGACTNKLVAAFLHRQRPDV